MISRAAVNPDVYRHTYIGRSVPEGAALFREAIREIAGPGKVLCARGNGTGPGQAILCDVGPGGLYEEPETPSYLP